MTKGCYPYPISGTKSLPKYQAAGCTSSKLRPCGVRKRHVCPPCKTHSSNGQNTSLPISIFPNSDIFLSRNGTYFKRYIYMSNIIVISNNKTTVTTDDRLYPSSYCHLDTAARSLLFHALRPQFIKKL